MAEEQTPARPLLARKSIIVNAPPDMSEEELEEKIKAFASWTAATYTQGPNGTVVDTPAGIDF